MPEAQEEKCSEAVRDYTGCARPGILKAILSMREISGHP